jgi:hypothetical protein
MALAMRAAGMIDQKLQQNCSPSIHEMPRTGTGA